MKTLTNRALIAAAILAAAAVIQASFRILSFN